MNRRIATQDKDAEPEVRLSRKRAAATHRKDAGHADNAKSVEVPTAGNLATQRLRQSEWVQTGSAVSRPGDADERQADRVADEVVAGAPATVPREHQGATPADSPAARQASASRAGGGQPLAEPERTFFAARMGHDFRDVRVHTDARAAQSARAVNALAYTIGQDIHFAAGSYAPHTASGRHLLAHELAHTVQQRCGRSTRLQRSLLPGGSGDWHEVAQAITVIIAGIDLAAIATQVAPIAIKEAGAYTAAGGDYGPQNALRHCMFAGLLDSWGWRAAIAELGAGMFLPILPQLKPWLLLYGATLAARVRLVLWAHEKFADDGCGNFGTGTVDSQCDQRNNEVGLGIGGPFTSDADVISAAKAALDGGSLWMTPGPTDLSTIVSTAGWRSGPWMVGGPQQPDCSFVTKK
jgi:hypothetical protein